MYSRGSGIIYGFHGCDKSIGDKVLNLEESLKESVNNYDWLGNGMYFWEGSPSRALDFATHLELNPGRAKIPIKSPFVIGAVINLGFCLDLLDYKNLSLLKSGYEILNATFKSTNKPIPINKPSGDLGELMLRELDCAVIETLHLVRKDNKLPSFDSVRGVFWEGKELYPNAGFREKDHIQICIRNPNCIKGFFLPKEINEKFKPI